MKGTCARKIQMKLSEVAESVRKEKVLWMIKYYKSKTVKLKRKGKSNFQSGWVSYFDKAHKTIVI